MSSIFVKVICVNYSMFDLLGGSTFIEFVLAFVAKIGNEKFCFHVLSHNVFRLLGNNLF